MPAAKTNSKLNKQSKKIQKAPNKFEQLVQKKTKTHTKILDERKTLLKEYHMVKNKNEVQDKRFLKKREPSSKFIEGIEKKHKKVSIFDLESDEDDTNIKFTHKGVDINEMDDFKDNDIDKEMSDDEDINAQLVNDFHFGGFEEQEAQDDEDAPERRKTKQEIYKELIHKSKKEKFLRQQQQMENEMKIEKIDESWQDIVQLLVTNPNQYKEKKSEMMKDDPYMKLQTELQSEIRMKPEAQNTLDPNRPDKKKKRKQVKFADDNEENEENSEDEGSELGADDEIVRSKNKDRRLKDIMKSQRHSKKFMNFVDNIKNLKEAAGKDDDEDELDDEEIDSDDDEGDDDEDGFDDDEDGLDDLGDDDDLGDEDDF